VSLSNDDREYVRLVAREAADEAIRRMKENGLMPLVRETARHETELALAAHTESCPFQKQLWAAAGKAGLGVLVLLTVVGALVWGAFEHMKGKQ